MAFSRPRSAFSWVRERAGKSRRALEVWEVSEGCLRGMDLGLGEVVGARMVGEVEEVSLDQVSWLIFRDP